MTTTAQKTAETVRSTEPLLVRVEVAARLLSLSRSTVYEMLASGELPSVRRGAARRIPVTAIQAWVAANVSGKPT